MNKNTHEKKTEIRHAIKNQLMAINALVSTFELKNQDSSKKEETRKLVSDVKERVEIIVSLLDAKTD